MSNTTSTIQSEQSLNILAAMCLLLSLVTATLSVVSIMGQVGQYLASATFLLAGAVGTLLEDDPGDDHIVSRAGFAAAVGLILAGASVYLAAPVLPVGYGAAVTAGFAGIIVAVGLFELSIEEEGNPEERVLAADNGVSDRCR